MWNQVNQRGQAIFNLESRVSSLEAQGNVTGATATVTTDLNQRLTALENSLGSIDLLATELSSRGSQVNYDDRISQLEAVLSRLEERLDRLENMNREKEETYLRGIEGDRFV